MGEHRRGAVGVLRWPRPRNAEEELSFLIGESEHKPPWRNT